MGLGRDGRSVLIATQQGEEWVLRELSPETGAMGEPLGDSDGDSLIFDPVSHKLIGVGALVGDEDKLSFFAPQDQRVWAAIVKAYPGQGVRLVSWSDDRRRVVVKVDSPTEGPAYAYVDLATKKASWIGGLYQRLKPQDISPVRPVRYKAADGLELSGYLTLPRDRDPKKLPLIVFPHGGPAARDAPVPRAALPARPSLLSWYSIHRTAGSGRASGWTRCHSWCRRNVSFSLPYLLLTPS